MNKKWPSDELLARLLNREMTAADKEAWDREEGVKDLEQILDSADRLPLPPAKTTAQAWQELQAKIQSLPQEEAAPKVVRMTPRTWTYALTGLAAVLLALWLVFSPSDLEDDVPSQTFISQSEPLEVTLPDGSHVRLNAQSQLSYQPETWDEERLVRLEGEAYFEVAKGSRFTVDGRNVDATVLGTRFNVYDRGTKSAVQVFEGKVKTQFSVSKEGNVLLRGDLIEKSSTGEAKLRKFEQHFEHPLWIEGVFSYPNGQTLNLVWQELSRQYGVEIHDGTATAKNKTFYGTFYGPKHGAESHGDNLEKALRTVVSTMGYQFEIGEDNKITVTLP
ncbi:MAG: FecR family protein [Bacteroidota bacterium]